MEAKGIPDPVPQPADDAQTREELGITDYEVPVDPHDGVDCEECQ